MSEELNDSVNTEEQAVEEVTTPAVPPASETPKWVGVRMGELAAKRREAEDRAAAKEAEIAQLREQIAQMQQTTLTGEDPQPSGRYAPTQAELDAIIQARAAQIAQQQTQQTVFAQNLAKIEQEGFKQFGDEFNKSVSNLQTAGVGGQEFLNVLTQIPGGEKVLTFLGRPDNIEEAIRIANLSPVQMGIEMMRLAGTAGKQLTKQVSKAPAPIEGLDAGGGAGGAEPKVGTPEWIEWRNKTSRKNKR